jgi:hypothetical protein
MQREMMFYGAWPNHSVCRWWQSYIYYYSWSGIIYLNTLRRQYCTKIILLSSVFLPFLFPACTEACLLAFSDLHDPNIPSCLRYAVQVVTLLLSFARTNVVGYKLHTSLSLWASLSEIIKVKTVMSDSLIVDFISSTRGSRCLVINDYKFN